MADDRWKRISKGEYDDLFPEEKRVEAVRRAFEIRQFEIQLYWTRASYFWTLIAADLAGYAAVQTLSDSRILSIVLASLGIVVSFGWYLANRGSKRWQENWENHVDLLEDHDAGPLYKVVLERPDPQRKLSALLKHALIEPGSFSVTKINQLLSLYVTLLFVVLLLHSFPGTWSEVRGVTFWLASFGMALLACGLMLRFGRTDRCNFEADAYLRSTTISNPKAATPMLDTGIPRVTPTDMVTLEGAETPHDPGHE